MVYLSHQWTISKQNLRNKNFAIIINFKLIMINFNDTHFMIHVVIYIQPSQFCRYNKVQTGKKKFSMICFMMVIYIKPILPL